MRVLESPESASPSVTRAVAAFLKGEQFHALELPSWQRFTLSGLDQMAPRIIPRLVRWENQRRALPKGAASLVDIDKLAAARVQDYAGWQGQVSTILLGSSLGGAAAYLAAALGAPFLPEPFILGFKGGSPHDHLEPHLGHAGVIGELVAANNHSATLISHFDPVHDGWLTRFLNHLRLKLRWLPASYQQFIQQHLKPGGTLLHLDCRAEWLSYKISGRHRYQVGGWGGISPGEFLAGSPRIDNFLERTGSPHRGGWRLNGIQPAVSRESEWGSEPEFATSLKSWAAKQGYQYQAISLPSPDHYSALAYLSQQLLLQKRQVEPQGVFVGMFNQYDPTTVFERNLLPLWLVFNTTESKKFLQVMVKRFPKVHVFFSALVTYSRTPDMVPWSQWVEELRDFAWHSIGSRPNRYPADTIALWRWQSRLKELTQAQPTERVLLSVDEIIELVRRMEGWLEQIPDRPKLSEASLEL